MALPHDRARATAHRLRKTPTIPERNLWTLIRDRQVAGLRFRRQHPIGPYIVDFCCPRAKLVVELDGGAHVLREVEDAARDDWLRGLGFSILRFSNAAFSSRPHIVLEAIRDHAAKIGAHTPHPSGSACHLPPQGGKDVTGQPEIWFYHLERSSLEQVLPGLLEKTRERGWKALVRVGSPDRLDTVDRDLWTYRDEGFLAHGRADRPHPDRQPILLSQSGENLNGAQALFILDGAELGRTEGYERCFILFDGRDDLAVQAERDRWKALKGQGANLAYWKQSPEGAWQKAA